VGVKKYPPLWRFLIFSPNGWEFLVQILYAYYTFLSTLDYKLLLNYLQLWRSYAILSATTQFTWYAQNVHHRPKRPRSDVCEIRWQLCWSLSVASHHRSAVVHFLLWDGLWLWLKFVKCLKHRTPHMVVECVEWGLMSLVDIGPLRNLSS